MVILIDRIEMGSKFLQRNLVEVFSISTRSFKNLLASFDFTINQILVFSQTPGRFLAITCSLICDCQWLEDEIGVYG